MTKISKEKLNSKQEVEPHKKILNLMMNEILFVLKDEIEKVEYTITDIKNHPRPDVEFMTMPIKLKCYQDGIKFAFKIINKYKEIESDKK